MHMHTSREYIFRASAIDVFARRRRPGGSGGAAAPPGNFTTRGRVAGGSRVARAPLDISREKKKEKRNHRPLPAPILHAPRNFILRSGPPLSDILMSCLSLFHELFITSP